VREEQEERLWRWIWARRARRRRRRKVGVKAIKGRTFFYFSRIRLGLGHSTKLLNLPFLSHNLLHTSTLSLSLRHRVPMIFRFRKTTSFSLPQRETKAYLGTPRSLKSSNFLPPPHSWPSSFLFHLQPFLRNQKPRLISYPPPSLLKTSSP